MPKAWNGKLEIYQKVVKLAERISDEKSTIDLIRTVQYIPRQVAAQARNSHQIPYELRLDAAISASQLDSRSMRCAEHLIDVMEERYDYERVIGYCGERGNLGDTYFRVLRAKMRVHFQLELNTLEIEKQYGEDVDQFELVHELYTPALRDQGYSRMALQEIREVLLSAESNYVYECAEVALRAYAVSWFSADEIIELIELCIDQIVKSSGREIGAGMIDVMEKQLLYVENTPPDHPAMVETREILGQAAEIHRKNRRNGQLIDTEIALSTHAKQLEMTDTNGNESDPMTEASVGDGTEIVPERLNELEKAIEENVAIREANALEDRRGLRPPAVAIFVVAAALALLLSCIGVGKYFRKG